MLFAAYYLASRIVTGLKGLVGWSISLVILRPGGPDHGHIHTEQLAAARGERMERANLHIAPAVRLAGKN